MMAIRGVLGLGLAPLVLDLALLVEASTTTTDQHVVSRTSSAPKPNLDGIDEFDRGESERISMVVVLMVGEFHREFS